MGQPDRDRLGASEIRDEAASIRDALAAKMTPAEVAQAQALAREPIRN